MDLEETNNALRRAEFQLRSAGAKNFEANPLRTGVHGRGYLPHVKRENAAYFVTFRLADSLPRDVVLAIERERAETIRRLIETDGDSPTTIHEADVERRRKIERYLDSGAGRCDLKRPEIARIVADALTHLQSKRYILKDWVVMPNHVHAVVHPIAGHTLSEILKSWKQFTAVGANRLLQRPGERFWQPESYDHWIRDPEENARIQRYIQNNPVKAGLCKSPEEWPWSSATQPS